jgi:hypothetical protein
MSNNNHMFVGLTNGPTYADALWENNDGESIPDFTLNSSIPGKYISSMTNILSKHCAEVKTNTDEIVQPIVNISRKRLKELITKHNNEIFAFMAKPDKTPQVIGLAETIFRRYGHEIPTIKGSIAGSILKDLNLDVSMSEITAGFDEEMKKNRIAGGGLDDYLRQTKWIFNQYKIIGEEILRLETILFQKVELLDKLNSRTPMITSLSNNEVLPELINTFAKYVESVYKSTNLEETYKELIEAYKKWNICRQIITLNSNFKSDSQNPQCAICLTEPVVTAIVPCGHTFCGNCIKKQNINCYICRGTIRERIKLYFT